MKAFLYCACAINFSHFVLYPDYRISFFMPLAFRFADYTGSKETAVEIDFNDLPEETLSDDKEFTDKDNGKLGFKDGVSQTQIGIRAKVQQVTEDGVKLKFYLFSKPVNCEGAKYELEIKTSDKQDD